MFREEGQTRSFRGSKSRNKVSVGEPAEGSLTVWRNAKLARRPSRLHAPGPHGGGRRAGVCDERHGHCPGQPPHIGGCRGGICTAARRAGGGRARSLAPGSVPPQWQIVVGGWFLLGAPRRPRVGRSLWRLLAAAFVGPPHGSRPFQSGRLRGSMSPAPAGSGWRRAASPVVHLWAPPGTPRGSASGNTGGVFFTPCVRLRYFCGGPLRQPEYEWQL